MFVIITNDGNLQRHRRAAIGPDCRLQHADLPVPSLAEIEWRRVRAGSARPRRKIIHRSCWHLWRKEAIRSLSLSAMRRSKRRSSTLANRPCCDQVSSRIAGGGMPVLARRDADKWEISISQAIFATRQENWLRLQDCSFLQRTK